MLIILNKATDKHIRNRYILLYLMYLKILNYNLDLPDLSTLVSLSKAALNII